MDYYIIPEEETTCEDSFPDGLSFFFEQVGGYGEAAEVEQVSRILQIDLSVFQEISFEEDEAYDADELDEDEQPEEASIIWHDVDKVTAVVDSFLTKIEAFPDYHKQVLHNPNRNQDLESLLQITTIGDEAEMVRQFQELENQPLFAYPPDHGYLSQGKIVEDLKNLRQTLACYKSSGVSQFKLLYM
ncbi:hypothetical protein [Hymenobacter negativus]|uniref:Uncharacterized protein n=1 Tax=Hymenobacter negativus TaxID=2795026 RepID=A0ABS3QJR1_9BACT|nr:hypothetical protein [Hymenobacter negativus]MBO2011491.1 hypothetical protein [Hymenobacter negativus]